jgi:hypothetical protein
MDFKLQKRLIYAGLAILLAADAGLAYYGMRLSGTTGNPEQVLKAEALRLSLMKADVEHANQIKASMPEVEKYFAQFNSTLPPAGKGYSVVAQEFDDIAHDTHVLVQDVSFHHKELTERSLDEIEIEASVVGDYTGLLKFLNQLQRSKNMYLVGSLTLEPDSGPQGPPGALKVGLRLRTYFRLQ